MAKMWWKKKKTIAMYINRRQHNFDAEFTPTLTSDNEILIINHLQYAFIVGISISEPLMNVL